MTKLPRPLPNFVPAQEKIVTYVRNGRTFKAKVLVEKNTKGRRNYFQKSFR
jgi:hypothetical protein